MNIMTKKIAAFTFAALTALGFASCNERKFHVEGAIENAADSVLYFENMGLNGVQTVDSVKLSADGTFAFDGKAVTAPEFYRLRIAGQIINVAIDSTETVTVKAKYPAMATDYEVSGSDDCSRIKELALMQMQLQQSVNNIARNPLLGADAVADSVQKVVEAYKTDVKTRYIFKAPMKASSYFALFQTLYAGGQPMLIFNPRTSEQDVRVFAAVATSWDAFYPNAERGANLHNIAIEGMKEVRMLRSKAEATLDPAKLNTSGVLDFALTDNRGAQRSLSSLKGKVVMLDFHVFGSNGSTKRIMEMRELYNKYHDRGFEIYQVAFDPDEHFWKTQTAALPWISVRDPQGLQSQNLAAYNVSSIPTFFLIDRNNEVKKRDSQITDIDAEINALLN